MSRRKLRENPLAMGTTEKVAIGVGLAAGIGAAIYYFMRPSTTTPAPTSTPVATPAPSAAVTLTPANAGSTAFVSVNGTVTVNLPLSTTVTSWTDSSAPGGTALTASSSNPQTSSDGSTMTFTYTASAAGYQTLTFTPSSGAAINFAISAS